MYVYVTQRGRERVACHVEEDEKPTSMPRRGGRAEDDDDDATVLWCQKI